MTTTYSTRADLVLAFGESNLVQWSDLNNGRVYLEIEARIDWARAQAYDELNSRLADSRYQFPLDTTKAIPPLLVRMEAYLAGVLLYESRGVTDVGEDGKAQHALMWHRKRVDEFVRDVYARRIVLIDAPLKSDALPTISETPEFVCFPDPGGRRPIKHLGDDFVTVIP
jgi:phage gp36-like protein